MCIRDSSSNASSDPLYVVDGLRTKDISNLDPNDIESMEAVSYTHLDVYNRQPINVKQWLYGISILANRYAMLWYGNACVVLISVMS